ncbi:hypothetical protein NE865_07932 [Phthorimaea operculella]|nr:hypothetical protein NE865_07932 [Phthorimaea operculella]
MDNESLIRLCRTSFNVDEIEEAKSLLFESVRTDKRKISRRKDGKVERDLQDIITVFKETDPEKIPVFVARELHRLPPVTFDHIDATRLLKDLLVLREDVTKLKAECVTKKDLQETLENRKPSLPPQSVCPSEQPEYRSMNVNKNKRGAYMDSFQLDSGPIGLMHVNEPFNKSNEQQTIVSTHKTTSTPIQQNDISLKICKNGQEGTTVQEHNTSDIRHRSAGCSAAAAVRETGSAAKPQSQYTNVRSDDKSPLSQDYVNKHVDCDKHESFVDIVNNGKPWQAQKPDEKWIKVQRKRLRNRFIGMTGQAVPEAGKFRAAETKVPMLVYNVDKEATVDDVKNYIYDKIGERVSLYKLHMQREKSYDSYKIFVAKSKLPLFLDNKLWPSDIKFRQFIDLRDKAYVPSKATGPQRTIN